MRLKSSAERTPSIRLSAARLLRGLGPGDFADAPGQLFAVQVDAADDPVGVYQNLAVPGGVQGAIHFTPAAAHPDVRPVDAELLEEPVRLRLVLLFFVVILRVHAQEQNGQL